MSDFIYSKNIVDEGKLTRELQGIYHGDYPSVKEFHGEWGSLAITENLYHGFQSYETDEHLCVVVGGPLLCFQDQKVMESGSSGTKAILDRMLEGLMKWDDDLSGPFAILHIVKQTSEVNCVTDLMSFIPVFTFGDVTSRMLSTHVDVLARVSGQATEIDVVSEVDFILHGIVTYPYTAFSKIRQIAPASTHLISANRMELISDHYWIPEEEVRYTSIRKAASELRKGLQNFVDQSVKGKKEIAQFISGGEDSRTLSGLLPPEIKRDAFIFLDHMNREGDVAQQAAKAYGANFHLATRSKTHYLDILPACADLVGKGSQYIHAHTFGFHKECRLNEYPAVFGGLFADALLKGARIKKKVDADRFPFLSQLVDRSYSAGQPVVNDAFKDEVLEEITKRRQAHFNYVRSIRKNSAEEWFELWPSSMNVNIPNIHVNRRLFRSYEPFMSRDVVKISAAVPQKWKLHRRLFQLVAKPFLEPTKWLLHGDGRLPYFPWTINTVVQFSVWIRQKVGIRTGRIKGNQGPWTEWTAVMESPEWKQAIKQYGAGLEVISGALQEKDLEKLFDGKALNVKQRVNMLQSLYGAYMGARPPMR